MLLSDLLEPLKRENDALRCKCEEISAALQSMQSMVENLNGVNKDKGPFFESLSSEYHIDLLKAEEAILLLNNELDNRSNLLAAARRERDRFFSELEVLKQRLHESEPALNISPVYVIKY
jgi:hypothetical protein